MKYEEMLHTLLFETYYFCTVKCYVTGTFDAKNAKGRKDSITK